MDLIIAKGCKLGSVFVSTASSRTNALQRVRNSYRDREISTYVSTAMSIYDVAMASARMRSKINVFLGL